MSGHPSEGHAARRARGLRTVVVRLEAAELAQLDAIVEALGLPRHGGRYQAGGRAEAVRELIRRNRPGGG